MLKHTIIIDEHSSPADSLSQFRSLCDNSNISDSVALYQKVELATIELADRGSKLASMGSHFNINRKIEGENFLIILKVSYGTKPSFVEKLRNMIGA
jgi:hypothetical protein